MKIFPVNGFKLGSTAANIRYTGRDDLVLIECNTGTQCAAVFTQNRFSAAPVVVAKSYLHKRMPRALLINSGNANAGTGKQGLSDAESCCSLVADSLGCSKDEVLPFSTGVIGARLPVDCFRDALPACISDLSSSSAAWEKAARAIMTTDTVPKLTTRQLTVSGEMVTITGMVKGAGMIRPDMATMLAFVATDANIEDSALKQLLNEAVNTSFNRITVDGDTSTNDACVLMASGEVPMDPLTIDSAEYQQFSVILNELMQELATSIIQDAEGATKFITINVAGGRSEADCLAVAYTVAESPLVKTAFFASDPNWGRILAAVGRTPGVDLDITSVNIRINSVSIIHAGEPDMDYSEEAGQQAMAADEITVQIEIGDADEKVTVWTSDLSHDYVRINAEYRT
jgi:glutamate N-acetyltransferase/amino-acid N-acetyltransferase